MDNEKVLMEIKEAEAKAKKGIAAAEAKKLAIINVARETAAEYEKAEIEKCMKGLEKREQAEREKISKEAKTILDKAKKEAEGVSSAAKRKRAGAIRMLEKEFDAFLKALAKEG